MALGVGQQVVQGLEGRVLRDHQHEAAIADACHRGEVPDRVERQLGVDALVDVVRRRDDQQGPAVGCRFGDGIRSQDAIRAHPVVDDHGRIHGLADFLGEVACGGIGGGARGDGRDQFDGAVRLPFLGRGVGRPAEGRHQEQGQAMPVQTFHVCVSDCRSGLPCITDLDVYSSVLMLFRSLDAINAR